MPGRVKCGGTEEEIVVTHGCPEEKKANKWPRRGNSDCSWPPAFPLLLWMNVCARLLWHRFRLLQNLHPFSRLQEMSRKLCLWSLSHKTNRWSLPQMYTTNLPINQLLEWSVVYITICLRIHHCTLVYRMIVFLGSKM